MRDGWVENTLEEISEVIMGQSPDGKTYNLNNIGLPFMQGSAEFGVHHPIPQKWCSEPKKIAKPGDLLLSVRAPVGDTNFADQQLAIGRGLSIIRATDKSITKFIRLVIQLNVADLIASSGSGMFSSITGKNLREFKIYLPPLPEQKRIVDLISSVDSYIEALQQQVDKARKSRNAVLHELLTKGGDGWVEKTLGEVADVIDPHPSHRAPPIDDEGIPFIGIGDLRRTGDIDFVKARRVSKEILEEHKTRYNRSDFLIGLGRVASIGMVVRLPDEKVDYAVSPTLAVIRAKDMLGPFLFYLLEGNYSQDQFQRFNNGSTRESVGMQILRKIKVHIPPLAEQKRIVEIISVFDNQIEALNSTIAKTKNLRSALLTDLLSGNHEIPLTYDKLIGAA